MPRLTRASRPEKLRQAKEKLLLDNKGWTTRPASDDGRLDCPRLSNLQLRVDCLLQPRHRKQAPERTTTPTCGCSRRGDARAVWLLMARLTQQILLANCELIGAWRARSAPLRCVLRASGLCVPLCLCKNWSTAPIAAAGPANCRRGNYHRGSKNTTVSPTRHPGC